MLEESVPLSVEKLTQRVWNWGAISVGKSLCGFSLEQCVSMLAQRRNDAIQDANTFLIAAYLLHKNPCEV